MTYTEFASLVGPPPAPPIAIDWAAVEAWLKLRLPSDYKEVASTYGPVGIGNKIGLLTPLSSDENPGWEYASWLKRINTETRRSAGSDGPDEVPKLHPTRGGLLVWGHGNGHPFFWDTSVSADPDEWTTVLFCREFPYVGISPWHRYDLSMTDFLATAIRTGIDPGTRWGVGPVSPIMDSFDFLRDARPWTAPVRQPVTDVQRVRRAALRKGKGLEALTVLVPPPEHPQLGGVGWDEVAGQLGTSLPSEYRALMDRYGAGEWRGWLDVFGRDDLVEKVEMLTGIYRELREQFPQFHPLAVWPEPGGFLPFALSIDGDQVGWLTVGDPEGWPVCVVPRDEESPGRWRTGLVDGLLRWSRGYAPPGMLESDSLDDLLELAVFVPGPADDE